MEYYKSPVVYAVKHKDENIRALSRSGGIFTALSDYILKKSGTVYGCVLNGKFEAVHIRAVNSEQRDLMRGSKYIQSNLLDTYSRVKQDLDNDIWVLFSGTSCQVAGLISFLGKEYEKLLTVDIICHGVPSNKVWHDYIKWNEKKCDSRCKSVDFRNKKDYGWNSHVETLLFENGKQVDSQIFKNLFYGHEILRPSCYKCPYKSVIHPANISIGDYWGIDNACPGFNDNKGVSLVLINNDSGKEWFENVVQDINCKPCRIEDSMQTPLKSPFNAPDDRDKFWTDYREKTFDYIAKKYGTITFMTRVKRKLKKIIRGKK